MCQRPVARVAKTKNENPAQREKDGVLGNPHSTFRVSQRAPGELSKRIGLHTPYSSVNKVTIEHRACFRRAGPKLEEEVAESNDKPTTPLAGTRCLRSLAQRAERPTKKSPLDAGLE